MESKYPKILKETKSHRIVQVYQNSIHLEVQRKNAMGVSTWVFDREISKLEGGNLFYLLTEPDVRETNP